MRLAPVAVAGLVGLIAGAPAVAQAPSSKAVVVSDPRDARPGGPDITRTSLQRASDGRVRWVLTLGSAFDGGDLRARSGPPGSLCLKVWTETDPPDEVPGHLVCVTARREGDGLRGSVLEDVPNGLPRRVATARVSRSSGRTIAVRFSQSSIGRPARVDFQAEATRAGCPRTSCIDVAPGFGRFATLALRKPASTGGA